MTVVAVVMNTVIHVGASGFYATFCSFVLLVLADFGGAPVQRFLAYLGTGIAGMVLIAIGAFVAPSLPLALVVTAIVTAILAFSVLLRGYVGTAYVSLLLTFVVAITTPQPVDTLPTALAAYFGGALVAGIAAVTMWPIYETPAISKAIGESLSAAAAVVESSPVLRSDATQHETDARFRHLLVTEQGLEKAVDGNITGPGRAGLRGRGLTQLVDDMGRLRIALRWPDRETARAFPADVQLLQTVRDSLSACGRAIAGKGPAPRIEPIRAARERHTRELPRLTEDLLAGRKGNDALEQADVSFYHRVTGFIAEMVVRHTRLALGVPVESQPHGKASASDDQTVLLIDKPTSPTRLLASNLTLSSPWLRRALQTMVAVTLAVTVVHVWHVQEGFWAVLGIVTALKLDASASRKTAWGAAVGTLGGFVIAVLLLLVMGGSMIALIALLPIVAFFATWFPAGRFELPLKQAGFTVWFIMLVSLAQGGLSITIDETRIIDVGIGLLISLIVTALMWPNGVAARVRSVLDESVRATAGYFTAAYDFITSPMSAADAEVLHGATSRAIGARVRVRDACDVAISQGGEAGHIATERMPVVSSDDHVFFTAATVSDFPNFGLAPIPDAKAARQLSTTAHRLADQYVSDIGAEQRRLEMGHRAATEAFAGHVSSPGHQVPNELSDVSITVESAVLRLEEGTGDLHFTVGPRGFVMSRGHAAVSLLWGLQWLRYFHWMAARTEEEVGTGERRGVESK